MKRWLVFVVLLSGCVPAFAQGLCDTNPTACVTLTGSLSGANGASAANYSISFKPSQLFFIGGVGTVVNTTSQCATSNNGSVVGLQNPTTSTNVSPMFSGSLPAGTYYTKFTFYDYQGNQTLPSLETTTPLTSTGGLTVSIPSSGLTSSAIGMKVYIGTAPGAETLQGTTVGTVSFVQSTGLAAGAPLPTINNSICRMVANDVVWPVGTGYIVSLADPSGNTLPGYPMQWQLLGAGTTINLSTGLPYYHGVVYFPTPLISGGVAGGNQVLNGNLTIGGTLTTGNGAVPGISGTLVAGACVVGAGPTSIQTNPACTVSSTGVVNAAGFNGPVGQAAAFPGTFTTVTGSGNASFLGLTLTSLSSPTPKCIHAVGGVLSLFGSDCAASGGGSVTGPPSTTINGCAYWNNTTGTLLGDDGLPCGTVRYDLSGTYSPGTRQVFTSSAATAGMNFASTSPGVAPPSGKINGDIYIVSGSAGNCHTTSTTVGGPRIGLFDGANTQCMSEVSDFGQGTGAALATGWMPRAVLPINISPVYGELGFQTADDNYIASTSHQGQNVVIPVVQGFNVNNTDCASFGKTGNTVWLQSATNVISTTFPCFDAAYPADIGTHLPANGTFTNLIATGGISISPPSGGPGLNFNATANNTSGIFLNNISRSPPHQVISSIQLTDLGFPTYTEHWLFEMVNYNGHTAEMRYEQAANWLLFAGDSGSPILTVKYDTATTPSVIIGFKGAAGSQGNLLFEGGDSTSEITVKVPAGVAAANGYVMVAAKLTTTAAASDNVSIPGVTSATICSLTATNASAAANLTTEYISAKTTNQITVTHSATAGMTYDILCASK